MPYSMSQPELEPICLIFLLPELRLKRRTKTHKDTDNFLSTVEVMLNRLNTQI